MLGLLVPFVVYNLALKATSVVSRTGERGFFSTLDLTRSDVFFNLGYVLLWVGLFSAAGAFALDRGLFHATTVLVLIVNTCAHQYFRESGTTLDYGIIAEWVPRFGEVVPILVRDVPLTAWMLLLAALFYAALGPWLLTRAVERWRGWAFSPRRSGISLLGPLGLFILASGFGALSLLIGPSAYPDEAVVKGLSYGA